MHKTLKCLLVDDEPLALELLESYLERVPFLQLAGKCTDGFQALQALQNNAIDLVFLDIEMPDLTGIELLKSLQSTPLVIFTTAYPNYAVEGFNLNALDYLLKPIPFDRFLVAVNKAADKMAARSVGNPAEDPSYLFIKADTQLLKVHLQDILYIEGLGDYVKIHARNQSKVIVTLQTLKHLSERLPPERFIRVHRSFIIALDKIDSINGQTIHIGNHTIPVGNLYKDSFFELIQQRNL